MAFGYHSWLCTMACSWSYNSAWVPNFCRVKLLIYKSKQMKRKNSPKVLKVQNKYIVHYYTSSTENKKRGTWYCIYNSLSTSATNLFYIAHKENVEKLEAEAKEKHDKEWEGTNIVHSSSTCFTLHTQNVRNIFYILLCTYIVKSLNWFTDHNVDHQQGPSLESYCIV